MLWRNSLPPILMLSASMVAVWPAVAQQAPESILPPGFGQPEPANTAAPLPEEKAGRPGEAEVPEVELRPPASEGGGDVIGDLIADASNNQSSAVVEAIDLPPQARRTLDVVGLLEPEDGGLVAPGFAAHDGRYLATLMRRIQAPIASRWASIALRRVLLSPTATPAGINGADWVAERAWLLLRMGEADMARALIARVDADNFTPRLHAVAMQAALATGDPASVCGVASAASSISDEPSWPLAQAMCAALSGESGTATAIVDRARDTGAARGVDVLLAEKVVGAAINSRRSVTIQWDGVDRLTAWRFGLATATGIVVPSRLFATVGPQARAWQARAPLLAPAQRASAVERAAVLGVYSSAALVDFFSGIWDATDPSERAGTTGELLRSTFTGANDAAKLAAMRSLWDAKAGGESYARSIMTARAAAALSADASLVAEDLDRVIASMLSAGLDIQATRWGSAAQSGSLGWALLAVGAPRPLPGIDASDVANSQSSDGDLRIRFLIAGLAGLGRLSTDDANQLAERYEVPLGRTSNWTAALDRAASAGDVGSVVVLSAAGLQTYDWNHVPPAHLYHIVAAMRRVGLEPEARMIAAEALARS